MGKTTTLDDALTLIDNGDTLGLGGMTIYRRPVAFAVPSWAVPVRHEISRCWPSQAALPLTCWWARALCSAHAPAIATLWTSTLIIQLTS